MNLVEVDHALRKLRLSGMADVLETRIRQAQAEKLAPLDLVATLVSDELQRRQDRLFERRHKKAGFRDPDRSLDCFDFDFNKKMNRALVYELATARFVQQREDVLFLGPPGTGKSHLAQALGHRIEERGHQGEARRDTLREVDTVRLADAAHEVRVPGDVGEEQVALLGTRDGRTGDGHAPPILGAGQARGLRRPPSVCQTATASSIIGSYSTSTSSPARYWS